MSHPAEPIPSASGEVGTISRLTVHPVKSAAGVNLSAVRATTRGLLHDRRFAVVDRATGAALTQRELPRLACLRPLVQDDDLVLTAPGVEPIAVPLRPAGEPCEIDLLGERVAGLRVRGYAGWLRAALEEDVVLCHQPDTAIRALPGHGTGGVQWSDAYPYLVVNAASARDVEERAGTELGIERYRANVVVDGAPAWAEDQWQELRCGEVVLGLVEPCVRCAVTTVDQATGRRAGVEPLATLARFRRGTDGGARFGVNAVARVAGVLRVGDPVVVTPGEGLRVSSRAAPPPRSSRPTTRTRSPQGRAV